jgi:type III restriction enzyme
MAEQGIDLDEATRWIEGLDRIHKTRRIQRCFDLSATPIRAHRQEEHRHCAVRLDRVGLRPERRDRGRAGEDAARGGARRCPAGRRNLRSKLYHIYRDPSVAEDLNRPRGRTARGAAEACAGRLHAARRGLAGNPEAGPRPGTSSPPVMLTVCNRTETAARIEHYFNRATRTGPSCRRRTGPCASIRRCSRRPRSARIGARHRQGLRGRLKADHRGLTTFRNQEGAVPPGSEEGRTAARDRRQRRQARKGRAGPPERHLGGDALGGLGRQERHPHHGAARLHVAAALRAGDRARPAARLLRHRRDGLFLPEYVNVFGVPLSIYDPGEGGERRLHRSRRRRSMSCPRRPHLEIRWPNVLRIESVCVKRNSLSTGKGRVADVLDPARRRSGRPRTDARRRDRHEQGHRHRPREAPRRFQAAAHDLRRRTEGVRRVDGSRSRRFSIRIRISGESCLP